MRQTVVDILDAHRVMTVATVRPDGWPQATVVGYANEGLRIYFLVSRSGQKFANIARDNRVSIAIGRDADELSQIKGLSMSALAYPIQDREQLAHAYRRLILRRPQYGQLPEPDWTAAAIVRAIPRDVAVIDFSQGLGHAAMVRFGPGEVPEMDPARPDDWGPTPRPVGG